MSLLLTIFYIFTLIKILYSQSNNTRIYKVGLKISSKWASGSGDTIWFEICNDEYVITINNQSSTQIMCATWYQISGGLDNEGEWYYFNYTIDDIGDITSMKILSKGHDELCLTRVSIGITEYDNTLIDCLDLDSDISGSLNNCDVMNVIFSAPENNNDPWFYVDEYITENCPYESDINNAYIAPPIPTLNGTKTYKVKVTTSNAPFSGTNDDLYFRLCNDEQRQTCTDYYWIKGGMNDEGYTYTFNWNTKDIGEANYADFATFGSDQWCISDINVDGKISDAGISPECISDDTDDGCTAILITLGSDIVDDDVNPTDPCLLDIFDNSTSIYTDLYVLMYEVSSVLYSGSDQPIFFILQNYDGGYSPIYEVNNGMDEEGEEYSFKVDVTDIIGFQYVNDIYTIDTFTYETDAFCISDISIGISAENPDILNADAGTFPSCIETETYDEVRCSGVTTYLATNFWDDVYYDDDCRWNDESKYGTPIVIAKDEAEDDIFTWMQTGYNWVIVSGGVLALVICCIVMCCICQYCMKKKHVNDAGSSSNGEWHGGNSAFYG